MNMSTRVRVRACPRMSSKHNAQSGASDSALMLTLSALQMLVLLLLLLLLLLLNGEGK